MAKEGEGQSDTTGAIMLLGREWRARVGLHLSGSVRWQGASFWLFPARLLLDVCFVQCLFPAGCKVAVSKRENAASLPAVCLGSALSLLGRCRFVSALDATLSVNVAVSKCENAAPVHFFGCSGWGCVVSLCENPNTETSTQM